MPTSQQNPDGTWTTAVPIPVTPTLDFEVTGHGPYRWDAFRGTRRLASGAARTRLGLTVALLRARRKYATEGAR
ncbi:hypothetical protein ACFYRI_14705 [Streptomyces microflavus]|uniref:hypothetical protein n=1 Tax=Streptomyces microflavus TaxID=1919 RepID=UPI0036BEBA14